MTQVYISKGPLIFYRGSRSAHGLASCRTSELLAAPVAVSDPGTLAGDAAAAAADAAASEPDVEAVTAAGTPVEAVTAAGDAVTAAVGDAVAAPVYTPVTVFGGPGTHRGRAASGPRRLNTSQ